MVRREPLSNPLPLPAPASTLEGREEQLIDAAINLVERRIHDGTASAQETVHFLKLGSVRNQLEQEKIRGEVEVLRSRVDEMKSRKNSEELYAKALAAMRGYQGLDDEDEEGEFYDPDLQ